MPPQPPQQPEPTDNIRTLADTQARQALAEDLGSGDLSAPLAKKTHITATLLARAPTVLCGQPWFESCFRALDNSATFNWQAQEGDTLPANSTVCRLNASAAALLTAERSAINFLQTLSATAAAAQRWQRTAGDRVKIVDTRKTLPLLRQAQKYAVRIGGAHNHRFGLYDDILIKENHIRAGGGIAATLAAARRIVPTPQIEVRNLHELRQAITAGATRVLLDNFSLDNLRAAVQEASKASKPIELEASGNITLENVAAVAATGVARISVGALTKHLTAADFSLLFDEEDEGSENNHGNGNAIQ